MTAGKAHGVGIYTTNSLELAAKFSKTEAACEKRPILVVEIVDLPRFTKTSNIFVIDQDDAVIIRFLLLMNGMSFFGH
jgi:hypothetical protein